MLINLCEKINCSNSQRHTESRTSSKTARHASLNVSNTTRKTLKVASFSKQIKYFIDEYFSLLLTCMLTGSDSFFSQIHSTYPDHIQLIRSDRKS